MGTRCRNEMSNHKLYNTLKISNSISLNNGKPVELPAMPCNSEALRLAGKGIVSGYNHRELEFLQKEIVTGGSVFLEPFP